MNCILEGLSTFTGTIKPSSATLASLALALALVRYAQLWNQNRTYWLKRGVKGEQPWPIFSSLYGLLFEDRGKSVLEKTRKYGKVYGTYFMGLPFLYIADPEVLRQVAIKDFDSFQNHNSLGQHHQSKYQRLSLLSLQGNHWKRVRALMTPSFTSIKMKRMYKILDGCADDLVETFREQCGWDTSRGPKPTIVDMMSIYSLYTMNGITTCGYGLRLERQQGDTDIKRASTRNQLIKDIKGVLGFSLARIAILVVVPASILRAFNFQMVAESTYKPVVDRIVALIERRRRVATKADKYDDLLQSLVDAQLGDRLELGAMDNEENHHAGLSEQSMQEDQQRLLVGYGGERLPQSQAQAQAQVKLNDDEIIASALFLMAAGFETTRASMSTISFLLAYNQEVQERLYQELKKIAKTRRNGAKGTDEVTFDYGDLTACKYLDAVISESLRFFGPSHKTDRYANADYYIEKYDIHVPKGTKLLLGMHSVAHDPDYWHEPQKFNPERFMPGQRELIVPGSYVPFSTGPRHCLGMRFSLTETKLGLAKVLMSFKLEQAPGTRYPPEPTRGISMVAVKDCRVLVVPRSISH